MLIDKPKQSQIKHHTLRIKNPSRSLAFYQDSLGMELFSHQTLSHADGVSQHFFLGFSCSGEIVSDDNSLKEKPLTLLELVYEEGRVERIDQVASNNQTGYWKIGVTVEDVDLARQSLLASGVKVGEAKQFLDVGYLCHLADPDGYCIELLQHKFAQNHQPLTPQINYRLRSLPRFGQITLRVKNPQSSLKFYIEGLGMRLLSRQVIDDYRFTLYFLAFTHEEPPEHDIDAVGNREWLWQRDYTVLELQHIWGTESSEFSYRVGADTGFFGIGMGLHGVDFILKKLMNVDVKAKKLLHYNTFWEVDMATVLDPDGYSVNLIEMSKDFERNK